MSLTDRMEAKGLKFTADMEDKALVIVESMMKIVWSNLLTNAIKFTELGGEITLFQAT